MSRLHCWVLKHLWRALWSEAGGGLLYKCDRCGKYTTCYGDEKP